MMRVMMLVAIFVMLVPSAALAEDTISVAIGGDVMFGRMVDGEVRVHRERLDEIAKFVADADISMVNLEAGICDRPERSGTAFPLLVAPPASIDILARAGIDTVSVANNHALDCGARGLEHGLEVLKKAGLAAVGHRRSGTRLSGVTMIGLTTHLPPYPGTLRPWFVSRSELALVRKRIEVIRASRPDDLIIVSVHWGREWHGGPAEWQEEAARSWVDAGANLIAGHGSHVAEPVEKYRGAFIAYGLGNLIFDGPPNESGLMAWVEFRRDQDGWRLADVRALSRVARLD